jgi:hypothetical protein
VATPKEANKGGTTQTGGKQMQSAKTTPPKTGKTPPRGGKTGGKS